ncbi:OmpA family protein [Aerosakkonemataceae cyanobacterium BLCC-F154]|uniref:OmpA family protein n=1 Tax=Floridaenema fluviatile BLCC-F154 TaxID=3153640 RepID=A0ABV4YK82_9CYAN
MTKLIRQLNLLFALFAVVGFSYLDFRRNNTYPKVTTLEIIPIPVSQLEVVSLTSTSVETANQTTPTTQLQTETQTVPETKLEVEPTTNTNVKVETSPTPATKVEVETPPPTKITAATVEKTMTELKAEKTKLGIKINLPEHILFDFDKYHVRATAKPTLTKLNQLLTYYGKSEILINGYTDSKGDDAYNEKLSRLRAAAVKYYFINVFKVPAKRLQTKGLGETQPIAPNSKSDGSDNPEGRQKNRRVEVIIKT